MNLRKQRDERIELQLTAMIDIVFLLLVFFVMTFRIVAQEGDFQVNMPRQGTGAGYAPSLRIKLFAFDRLADASMDGRIAKMEIYVGAAKIAPPLGHGIWNAKALRAFADGLHFDDDASSTSSATLVIHPRLKYTEVISVVTAIAGKIDPETGDVIKLFEKINFERLEI